MPIGDTKPQRVDVRVLAATNADLEQRVAEGKFREDLYYRLSVIRIHVPPLRERREEIPHLSTYFLREAVERLGKPDVLLSSETLDVFSQYWWPGNVRQLKNEIQRAVALSVPGGTIEPSHLSPEIDTHAAASGTPRLLGGGDPRGAQFTEPGVGGRTGRTRSDSGGARPRRRQHLGDGAVAGSDAARPLSEDSAARAGRTRRSRRSLTWILSTQLPPSVYTQ